MAHDQHIPVIMDAETEVMKFPGFPQIIENTDYIKCGETFPQKFTNKEDKLEAMNIIMDTGVSKKLVAVTLGAQGAIALQRGDYNVDYPDIADFNQLKQWIETHKPSTMYFNYKPSTFSCAPSTIVYCPPYTQVEVSDPTGMDVVNRVTLVGAGDVHLGALVYGITQQLPIAKALRLSAVVASMKCRFSGTKGIPKLQELDMQWINQI